MTNVLQLLLAIIVMIAGARLAGLLARRLGQPAVLGQLLAGVVLGPSAIDLLGLPFMTDVHLGESLLHLADLGVVFLMFIAGLEVDLRQLRRAGTAVMAAGLLGVIVPLAMGWGSALPFGYTSQQAFFIGMLLTATSVSISAQTLFELGKLRTKVGVALLGAAVVDDVVVILLVSLVLALTGSGGGAGSIAVLLLRMVAYFAIAGLVGLRLVPRLLTRVERLHTSEGLLSATVVVVLSYALFAEVLGGLALITGAFLAGIFVARSPLHREIENRVRALAYGFFVPIFFADIGLNADIGQLSGNLIWLTLAITAVAIVSKVIGSGLGARLGGFNNAEAINLGIGMISRGEVGLIVANLLVGNGLLGGEILTVAVVMVLATTLVTPPLLRLVIHREDAPAPVQAPATAPNAQA